MNTMSSSTFSIQPSLLDKKRSRDSRWSTADHGAPENVSVSTTSFTVTSLNSTSNLSPYSHIASSSTSPLHNASTPADSLSAFSEQYPSSDYSDRDPFFGVDFDDVNGSTPGFLEDLAVSGEDSSDHSEPSPPTVSSAPDQNACDPFLCPISSAAPTPYIHTIPPHGEQQSSPALGQTSLKRFSHPISDPAILRSVPCEFDSSQLGSDSTSGTSTTLAREEGIHSTTAPMPTPSPRVTVSMWGRDQILGDTSFPEDGQSPSTVQAGGISADDASSPAPYQRAYSDRNEQGVWTMLSSSGPSGWGPENRPVEESASINEINLHRNIAERNLEIARWRTASEGGVHHETRPTPLDPVTFEQDGIDPRDLPLGSETENKPLPGQTYYTEGSGPLTEDDFNLMKQHRLWSDAPAVYRIDRSERTQPETAQAAMQRFEQMCQETGSVLSRSATWGTRRRSLPSIADMEGVTSGSFLKKLSINRDRKPSIIFKELRRGLMRKPSANQLLKRHRTVPEDTDLENEAQGRRESQNNLAPPSRASSWAKKQQMPSLNTALVSMATGAAAIGTTHARSGSISNVSSPKSPFFKNVRRPRSRSELPKAVASNEEAQSALVGMWKKSGGPPVAQLARGASGPELDEDDDEDDDLDEEGDARAGVSDITDDLIPSLAGFRAQVLRMNPRLAEHNTYLVDRIAHQQVVRYKDLLNKRVKHMQQTNVGRCPSGHMCIASGGSAIPFDAKGEPRGVDPLAMAPEAGSDDEGLVEGVISPESFPMDIPMPPTTSLPAEFECQLCYSTKKFTKPSDWTKHVHEDVQPFTCTWDRCREPKIFKRKADWVRHENEGHRHLEWWTCDVEECRHTCYRRDNFLQHLVREHKFPEPKVKTKAALKRAGAQDITWQMVEKCHADTMHKPQDEPCRFCGKTMPTWKKLTVHLAKHMETMSLPILRLVSRKELDADTIISPVQDPPPRSFPPMKSETTTFSVSPSLDHSPATPLQPGGGGLAYQGPAHTSYSPYASGSFPNFYDSSIHGLQPQGALNLGLHHQSEVGPSFHPSQTGYQTLHGASSGFLGSSSQYNTMPQQLEPFPAYSNPLGLQDASGSQIYDTTALNFGGGDQQQYSHQGSASPYSRSPHQGQGSFYHPQ